VEKNLREGKMGFWLDIIYMKSVHFPILSRQMVKRLPVDILNFRALLQERKNKYMFIKTNIKSDYLLVDGDKDSEVNPLYVPIFLPIEKLELARERLKTDNINLDILHFDVNRNVFDSRYEKCLAIPCLYQVKMPTLEKICHIINEI
jgi:hypothetical protein